MILNRFMSQLIQEKHCVQKNPNKKVVLPKKLAETPRKMKHFGIRHNNARELPEKFGSGCFRQPSDPNRVHAVSDLSPQISSTEE
jgi:hypothetical protein